MKHLIFAQIITALALLTAGYSTAYAQDTANQPLNLFATSLLILALGIIILLLITNRQLKIQAKKQGKLNKSLQNINNQLDNQVANSYSSSNRQADLFTKIFRSNTSPMLLINPATGEILDANAASENFYGYPIETLTSMYIYQINQLPQKKVSEEMQRALIEERNYFIFPHKLANGEVRQVEVHSSHIIMGEDKLLLTIVHDITERFLIEKRLQLHDTALNQAANAIAIVDKNGEIIWANRAYNQLTGYRDTEAIGTNIYSEKDLEDSIYDQIKQVVANGESWQGVLKQIRKNGDTYYSETTITPVYLEDSDITHFVAVMQDITLRRAAEQQLRTLAFYDPLTNLPNKRLLRDRIETLMAQTARSKNHGSIIFIDLDRLKSFNDNYGHKVGDSLIKAVAERIQKHIPKGDTLARFGGDEFVIVLADLNSSPVRAAQESSSLAETIREDLNNPFVIYDQQNNLIEHTTSASMGITIFQGTNKPLDDLLKWSEMAMYQAKASGRNIVRLFDPNMQTQLHLRNELEQDLRKSIDLHHFELHYQPQVDYNGRVLGAEALLRWRHPDKNFISPGEFIPVAEEAGLIIQLGDWVLEEACRQLAIWRRDPVLCTLPLAVNISAKQMHHSSFVDRISQLVRRHNINPLMLKLEITESILIEQIEDSIRKMKALRALGIQFSIDDFGTGYSSLAYLKQLPISQIKIDQSFVQDLGKDEIDAAIVKAIISLGHNFQMNVVAEGVETQEQLKILSSYQCEIFQGYYFNPPLPLTEFISTTKDKN